MTNRIIKKSHFAKSKIFITFLCIFGLAFSYGCRKSGGGGVVTTDPTVLTPSISLSRELMVIDSGGTKTTKGITLTVANADIETFSITDDGSLGLTKDDFSLTEGVLSLNNNFGKLTDHTEKTLTLTVNYKKKTDAGADTTLSKTTDTKTFKIIKAEKLDDTKLTPDIKNLGVIGQFNYKEIKGGEVALIEEDKVDNEKTTDSFITELNHKVKQKMEILTAITGFDFVKVEVTDNNKTATFYFIVIVKDQYETDYNSKDTAIRMKATIGSTEGGAAGGAGTWKNTSTPQS